MVMVIGPIMVTVLALKLPNEFAWLLNILKTSDIPRDVPVAAICIMGIVHPRMGPDIA